MASQGNLYPPDFSGSNPAAERKAPSYVKGFYSLGRETLTMKDPSVTISENKYFENTYGLHTLANNYEYVKYLKGYTEGFFIDLSGSVAQGKGYLKNSIYPVALYCLPSNDTTFDNYNDSLKAMKEKIGVTNNPERPPIYYPDWLSQIYDNINIYSDQNIYTTDFIQGYKDYTVDLSGNGYRYLENEDYFKNQGIGSRVPLINVPLYAYTDSSGQVFKVKMNNSFNQVDRSFNNFDGKLDEVLSYAEIREKYSLENEIVNNSYIPLGYNLGNERNGHLDISGNKLKYGTGNVENVVRFINTNYYNFNPINETVRDPDYNYSYNSKSYNMRVQAKILPFNLLINNSKQIDTINFVNRRIAIKSNTELVQFNSIQKSKYYYDRDMSGIQNFPLDLYQINGDKTYVTLKDTPFIPNNLISNANHLITSINDEIYMYVLVIEKTLDSPILVLSRESIFENDVLKSNDEIKDIIQNYNISKDNGNYVGHLFYVGDDNKKEQNIGKLIKTPIEISLVSKPNNFNPLDVITGGTSIKVTSKSYINSLGWDISSWNWNNTTIDSTKTVPNTNTSIRDLSLLNAKKVGTNAILNNYAELFYPDTFEKLVGLYYYKDDYVESFIYISPNIMDNNQHNVNIFFRKESDFTGLMPSNGNNFKTDISGNLFNSSSGAIMDITNINSQIKNAITPDVLGSSGMTMNSNEEVYISFLNNLSIINIDSIGIEDNIFTGVPSVSINKIKPDMVVTYSNNEMITIVGNAENNKLILSGVDHSNIVIGMNVFGSNVPPNTTVESISNSVNTQITLSNNMNEKVQNTMFSFINIVDSLVIDISGQKLSIESDIHTSSSKNFVVTNQRYLYHLDDSHFGITEYNDYLNIPAGDGWKIKFYAQNNLEVNVVDLFGSSIFTATSLNNWITNGRDPITPGLEQQTKGIIVSADNSGNEGIGCWFIENTNCAATDKLFTTFDGAQNFADTYFDGLATQEDLINLPNTNFLYGDSWGNGFNPGRHNYGFKGSNGSWYWAYNSIPSEGIRAIVKLKENQLPIKDGVSLPENVLGHIIKVNLYSGNTIMMSGTNGSSFKGVSIDSNPPPQFTLYYKKTASNSQYINNEVWFKSTINQSLLLPPSLEETSQYNYNYDSVENNPHLNNFYFSNISYDKPISGANYEEYTNPSVILDGKLNTSILLVRNIGYTYPEIHNVTLTLNNNIQVNKLEVSYQNLEGKPYQLQLITSYGEIKKSFDLQQSSTFNWQDFKIDEDFFDIKYIKISSEEYKNNFIRCFISAIKINDNMLTNRNSWLISWGDLSVTQKQGDSNFLVGENKSPDFNLDGANSIVSPRLANKQNYLSGIQVKTIPENITPTSVKNPNNIPLTYIGKDLLYGDNFISNTNSSNLTNLPSNKYIQFRFIFPRRITMESFSFAFYNYHHSYQGFNLLAIDPTDNTTKTLLSSHYLYTGGNWFGIKGVPDTNGILPGINNSSTNYIYRGSHKDVTDSDMVTIPNHLRVSATEYRLGIYLSSDPWVYIYYVRFKGQMSKPNINTIPSLKSFNFKLPKTYYYKIDQHILDGNDTLQYTSQYTTDNIINSKRVIDTSGNKGYINVGIDTSGIVSFITPYFTKNTYYKIVDKVGAITLKLDTVDKITSDSKISIFNASNTKINELSDVDLFNIDNVNDNVIANILQNNAGLLSLDVVENQNYIKNIDNIKIVGSTFTEHYSESLQINLKNNVIINGDNLLINTLYNDISGSLDNIVYINKIVTYNAEDTSFVISDNDSEYNVTNMNDVKDGIMSYAENKYLLSKLNNNINGFNDTGFPGTKWYYIKGNKKEIKNIEGTISDFTLTLTKDNPGTIVVGMLVFSKYIQSNTIITEIGNGNNKLLTLSQRALQNGVTDDSITFETLHNDFDKIPYNSTITIDNLVKFVIQQNSPQQNLNNPIISNVVVKDNYYTNTSKGIGGKYLLELDKYQSSYSSSLDTIGVSFPINIKILDKGNFYETGDIVNIDLRENKIARFFVTPPFSIYSFITSFKNQNIDNTDYTNMMPFINTKIIENQFSPLYLIKTDENRFFTSLINIDIDDGQIQKLRNTPLSTSLFITLFKLSDYGMSSSVFKPPLYNDFFYTDSSGNIPPEPKSNLLYNYEYLPDLILKNIDSSGNILHINAYSEINIRTYLANELTNPQLGVDYIYNNDTTDSLIENNTINMDSSNIIAYDFMMSTTTNLANTTSDSTDVLLEYSNLIIKIGQRVIGTGIAEDTIVSAVSGTSLTLSKNATITNRTSLTFISENDVKNYSINGDAIFGSIPKITDLQLNGGINMKSKQTLEIPSIKNSDSNTIRNFTIVIWVDLEISYNDIIPKDNDEIKIFNFPTNRDTDERLYLSILNIEGNRNISYGYANNIEQGANFNLPSENSQRHCFICTYKAITADTDDGSDDNTQSLQSDISLFFDGIEKTKNQDLGVKASEVCQINQDSAGILELGAPSTDNGFINGKILTFQMYNRILSFSEKNALYNMGTLPSFKMGYVLEQNKYLSFFRKLNIDPSYLIKDTYQNMTNESDFSGIIQPIKNCNNKFCRSDFSGNYIYEGYFNKSYLTADGLQGIPIQFPIVSCGGKLPNYYPESQINTILNEFTTTTGDLESLNNNESGFYRMYFKFLSSNKTPIDDPSLFPDNSNSAMYPCDILGNTLRSSNFTFRLGKFLDEINNAKIPNNREEADYLILLNTIINLLKKNKVYGYNESTATLPRIITLMNAYLDNLQTAVSYQLLYIKIIKILPTDDDLELFDDVINDIIYAIDTHSYYLSNNIYLESKWALDFSGVQYTIFNAFENIPLNGNWSLIKNTVTSSINNKLYSPDVVLSNLQTWMLATFNTIMFDTTSNFVTDVIDELYYFSIGNTLDLSGYPILFRKEKRNIIKLIKNKNEKVITLNDVSGINIGMRFIPAKYSTDNNLTTSNYGFSNFYVTNINQNNIQLNNDIQSNSDIVTNNFYNTAGNKYEYQPASFLPNTLVSVVADVSGSKIVNYPTVIKVAKGITVNNKTLTIDLTVSPQANLITKGQRVTGLSISQFFNTYEQVFVNNIVKPDSGNNTITINLSQVVNGGDQFIFSDREPLLFNREDYKTNENTIKIIVKGSKATTNNATSTLDNIKLGMCMFKSSEPTIIENTSLKVGKPIDYNNPIPIISFSKIAVNNNSFPQGSISSDKTHIIFNQVLPSNILGFHIRGEGLNPETTVANISTDGTKTNILLSNEANISTTDKTYYFSDLSYGIVEIEKQFGNNIFILNTEHLVFEYYDYYYSKDYQLFPPGTSIQINEDIDNNITLLPNKLSGIVDSGSTIGNYIPDKYGKNKFPIDISVTEQISGNYVSTPSIKKYKVNITADKFEIKDDQTSETFNNIFIEGNIYEFDISDIGQSHIFSFSLTEDGVYGGGIELIDSNGIIISADNIRVLPDKLYSTYVYYYCTKHPNYGGKIDIMTGTSDIYIENQVVYPTNNLQKRYNVTIFGPLEAEKNKICYLKKTMLTTAGQKYLFKCDIWIEQLSIYSSNIKNGSVFIFDGDIKLIKSDIGISDGNTQTNISSKYEIYDDNNWSSISADITAASDLLSIVFVSYNYRVAIDDDSLSLVTEDHIPPSYNYGNTIHTLDFKEVVEVEIDENTTSDFVSNLEIGHTGGMVSNNSTLYLNGDISYQNSKIDNVETGGTIFIDLSPFPGRLGKGVISNNSTEPSQRIGCQLNFEDNLLQFTQYLSKQLNDKSINKLEYDVIYNNSTGYFQIKHSGNNSTSKTSFYVRKNYSYNSSSNKHEVIYERVYRKVKTYFDFSKLTSVGGILGFISNDTQFCYQNTVVTSNVSLLDNSSKNYRRINLLRYISTIYGMEYTIGMHIDVNGNESNRPLDNSENSVSDSNNNYIDGLIDSYVNEGVSEISNENLSALENNNLSSSELLEKQLIDFNADENKKIKVEVGNIPGKYWLRDISGNWTSHFDN